MDTFEAGIFIGLLIMALAMSEGEEGLYLIFFWGFMCLLALIWH